MALCLAGYHHFNGSWSWFAALFLLPDLTMAGYLLNPVFGARLYNLGHSYVTPALLAALFWTVSRHWTPVWLIWPAHIAFDRVLGYGLKYSTGFKITHLGQMGLPPFQTLEADASRGVRGASVKPPAPGQLN